MTFTVIKLPDEPILLIRLQLASLTEADTAQRMRAHVMRYRDAVEGTLYVVWDLARQDVAAGDVQLLLYDVQEQPTGTIADPRLCTAIVSLHPVVGVLRRKVHQQFGVEVWQFTTVDEALGWVRGRLSEDDDSELDDDVLPSSGTA